MAGDIGTMLLYILPEIWLVLLITLLLVMDLACKDGRFCKMMGWFCAIGTSLVALLSIFFAYPGETPLLIWGGMLRLDMAGFIFRIVFLLAAAITALFSMGNVKVGQRGEFYTMLLVSTLGMSLMVSSADIIMVYLAVETTTIPLYVMAGFLRDDKKSTEAGIKYLLAGAMTSAMMLYGFSLLYGFSGSTSLYQIAAGASAGQVPMLGLAVSMVLVLVGFAFKISGVPLHFWAPDVYEGAPTPVAGFLSTASKAAGMMVLVRVFASVFPVLSPVWVQLVAVMAVASMLLGNLLAIKQTNIKRLLAYSSIAQAGYILLGVAANSQFGVSATTYYLFSYLVTNLAAFGVVSAVGQLTGSDEIKDYAGLYKRSPALAFALLVALLSLGGIPPFSGFFGKLLVFAAAFDAHLIWLVLAGVINAVISLYYYLTVIKVAFLYPPAGEAISLKLDLPWQVALAVCVLGIVVLGTVFAPFYDWSTAVGLAMLAH
jgi:NADH-quinone oxidoreductase subunit N